MREIKFRAWDVEEKKIFQVDNIEFGKFGDVIYITSPDQNEYSPIYIELMQFTGLKDNKGKEIYEGDIVNDFGEIEGGDRFGVIIFKDENGAFMVDGCCGYPYFIREGKELQVIGNIYENPKLLEAQA